MSADSKIRVGLTEAHGMAKEMAKTPPKDVEYIFLKPAGKATSLLQSPIKGYFRAYDNHDCDLIEAVLCPVITKAKWIYSIANFHEAVAFNFLGVPLPRRARFFLMRKLMAKQNFKKLIFWSHAGKDTLYHYCDKEDIVAQKSVVVYPAIRRVDDALVRHNASSESVNILFSGDFFRKGGVNVLDAFAMIQKEFPTAKLILCCDEKIDFNTPDEKLKREALAKIAANSGIICRGRIPRDELLEQVLPATDIYLLPSYVEAFGFAVLEAMAYGIPVIATNYFALPELIEHGVSGYLIDTKAYDCNRMFKGYVVNNLPADFRDYVTMELYRCLYRLIESPQLRHALGNGGLMTARTKFSFAERCNKMQAIYAGALE